jgi:hypothetical protein
MISSRWNSSIAPRIWKTRRPGRRGRIDVLPEDDQPGAAAGAQLVGEREQVLERPHGAGQPGDDEHVALAQVGQGPVELHGFPTLSTTAR